MKETLIQCNLNNQMLTMLQQMKANPLQMLRQRFNIPDNISASPEEIIQHLLNSGQISQQQVNNIMQMRKMFMK